MKLTKSLLEKAKTTKRTATYKPISKEEIELALAWVNDEVSYSQAQEALTGKRGGMTAYVMLARALRAYILSIETPTT